MTNFLRKVNYCIDDKAALEITSIIVYTKYWKNGMGFSTFEYCPKCEQYLGEKGMEKNLSKVVIENLSKNHPDFKPKDFIKAEHIK